MKSIKLIGFLGAIFFLAFTLSKLVNLALGAPQQFIATPATSTPLSNFSFTIGTSTPLSRFGTTTLAVYGSTTIQTWINTTHAFEVFNSATNTVFKVDTINNRASSSALIISNLVSCNTIDTDADGLFSCGTDAGGGLSAYDAWTHPVIGDSATTSRLILGHLTASSTITWGLNITNGLGIGGTATTTILGNGATSTFSGGGVFGGLNTNEGLVVSGGKITSTDLSTSTFTGGLSLTTLTASAGMTITGGSISLSSGATSTFNNGFNLTGGCFSLNGSCTVQNLTAGNFLTGTSTAGNITIHADSALSTGGITWNISSSTMSTTTAWLGAGSHVLRTGVDFQNVYCYTDAGSAVVNIQRRSSGAPNASSTMILKNPITCNMVGASSSVFTLTTANRGAILVPVILDAQPTSTRATRLDINLGFTKQANE